MIKLYFVAATKDVKVPEEVVISDSIKVVEGAEKFELIGQAIGIEVCKFYRYLFLFDLSITKLLNMCTRHAQNNIVQYCVKFTTHD